MRDSILRYLYFASSVLVLGLAHSDASPISPLSSTLWKREDQCSLAQNWPHGPGNILEPQPPGDELKAMLAQVDPRRVQAIIEKLVSFGTRHTASSQVRSVLCSWFDRVCLSEFCDAQTDPNTGIGAARDWIAGQMREFASISAGRFAMPGIRLCRS